MSSPSPIMNRRMFVPYPSKPGKPTELPRSEERMSDDYRSSISYRNGSPSSISRPVSTTSYASPSSPRKMVKVVNEISSSSIGAFGQHAAVTVRDSRERERKDLSVLNDRLASYIEKVRFLEAQNRKLGGDLDLLRGKWGKDSGSIQYMYELEIKEARTLVANTNAQRLALEREIQTLIDEVANYRSLYKDALSKQSERYDDLLEKLCKIEADINFLKRKITAAEEEIDRLRKEKQGLIDDLQKARSELDQETLNRIDFHNQVTTLLEEIDFMKRVNESEIRDLQLMAARDTTVENREYFKNELMSAMREIRQEYDQRMQTSRTDMESWYRMKVQEVSTSSTRANVEHGYAKEEVKRLRNYVSDVRGKVADLENRNALLENEIREHSYEHEDLDRAIKQLENENATNKREEKKKIDELKIELAEALANKTTLEAEIEKYRVMMEEEDRRSNLRHIEELRKSNESKHGHHHHHQVEETTRSSWQKSAKGNVSIQEVCADGTYITLENTHRSKEENLGGWELKRRITGKKEIFFTFPNGFVLKPLKTVKIFAKNKGMANGIDVLVHQTEDSFGVGHHGETILYNRNGEERSTLIYRGTV